MLPFKVSNVHTEPATGCFTHVHQCICAAEEISHTWIASPLSLLGNHLVLVEVAVVVPNASHDEEHFSADEVNPGKICHGHREKREK